VTYICLKNKLNLKFKCHIDPKSLTKSFIFNTLDIYYPVHGGDFANKCKYTNNSPKTYY